MVSMFSTTYNIQLIKIYFKICLFSHLNKLNKPFSSILTSLFILDKKNMLKTA